MRSAAALLSCLFALGCVADRSREADRPYTAGLARVEALEVRARGASPGWPEAVARGTLPDACTELESPDVRQLGASFEVTLATRRRFGARCPASPVRFEKRISLPVDHGVAGAYVVSVNGVVASFTVGGADPDLFRHPDLP